MPKEIFIVRNRITLQAAILNCSEAVVHSLLFSKISLENTGGIVHLLVKLQLLIIYQNDSTKNVFLEIFRKLLERQLIHWVDKAKNV